MGKYIRKQVFFSTDAISLSCLASGLWQHAQSSAARAVILFYQMI